MIDVQADRHVIRSMRGTEDETGSAALDAWSEALDEIERLKDGMRRETERAGSLVRMGLDLEAENHRLKLAVCTLYDAIQHGDDGHRKWLYEAIERHFFHALSPEKGGADV